MTLVTLGRSAAPVHPRDLVPARVRLPRAAVEHLAALTGSPLPWPPAHGHGKHPDPVPELRRLGLLTLAGEPAPGPAHALAVLGAPEVVVDLDVAVRRAAAPDGSARLRSWQRLHGDRVCALSTTGGELLELGWCDVELWQVELARAVTVAAPPTAEAPPPGEVVLPHALLMGSGEAIRRGRPDLLAALVARHGGDVQVDDRPLDDAADELVRRLHRGALGRMRAVVAGVAQRGQHRVGWVGWVLFADGWHALTPEVADEERRVRVHRVEPLRLGVEVARLVTAVRP